MRDVGDVDADLESPRSSERTDSASSWSRASAGSIVNARSAQIEAPREVTRRRARDTPRPRARPHRGKRMRSRYCDATRRVVPLGAVLGAQHLDQEARDPRRGPRRCSSPRRPGHAGPSRPSSRMPPRQRRAGSNVQRPRVRCARPISRGARLGSAPRADQRMRFLWRFFRSRFFRLCVAIFLRLRFFPEPIDLLCWM